VLFDTDVIFLLVNASVLWGVITAALTWLLRSKLFVLVILVAPVVVATTFVKVPGVTDALGWYVTSLAYGIPGIVIGVLYADYVRTKAYFQRISKSSFLARGAIALSSTYLLSHLGQQILFSNPTVVFLLDFVDGGGRLKELASMTDNNGAYKAGGVIAASFGLLGFNQFREHRRRSHQQQTALIKEDTP